MVGNFTNAFTTTTDDFTTIMAGNALKTATWARLSAAPIIHVQKGQDFPADHDSSTLTTDEAHI
jgi:hypothetical protein